MGWPTVGCRPPQDRDGSLTMIIWFFVGLIVGRFIFSCT